MLPFYAERNSDGTYDGIFEQLNRDAIKNSVLANATYRLDYTRYSNSKTGGYDYVYAGTHTEFQTIIFREICHSQLGTVLSAKGNHYIGPDVKVCYLHNLTTKDESLTRMIMVTTGDIEAYHRQIITEEYSCLR